MWGLPLDLSGGVDELQPARPLTGADGCSSDASAEPIYEGKFPWHDGVHVPPFTRQIEDGEVVIGHPQRAVFLALPVEAVEILDLLAAGRTVAEARDAYQSSHGEIPDIQDLLSTLADQGFVAASRASRGDVEQEAQPPVRFHFVSLPQSWARLAVHPVTGGIVLGLIASAAVVALRRPDLVPGWRALVFPRSTSAMVLLLMGAALLTTFFHEMAHLTVARARGISSRLGIGNRLWVLVAETDLSGLWSVPRRQRYLPLLAGMILDAATAALLILIFYADATGLLPLPVPLVGFLRALWMIYVLRIAWQFLFFVRTDIYYVFAAAFGCKNLMRDTEDFLRNTAHALLGRPLTVDQSSIRAGEWRAIRGYALLWLAGRGFAIVLLFTVTLPVLLSYVQILVTNIRNGPVAGGASYTESILIAATSLTVTLAGFALWFRSFRQSRRSP